MLPAVIGILRVGACYVPIDTGVWSKSRAEDVLRELAAPVAIVTTPCPELPLPTITVNFQKTWLSSPFVDASSTFTQLDRIRQGLRTDDLVWIVFTSGTTGRPKGVMIYHKGISSLVSVIEEGNFLRPDKGKEMSALLPFSIAFDGKALFHSNYTNSRAKRSKLTSHLKRMLWGHLDNLDQGSHAVDGFPIYLPRRGFHVSNLVHDPVHAGNHGSCRAI